MGISSIPAPSSYRGKFFAIATGQVAGQLHDQLNFCAPLFCGPNQLERWKMEHSGNPQDLPPRGYRRNGGRPPLDVDFVAVCDAVLMAWNGSGESITDIALRFWVSRGWIHKWVYPKIRRAPDYARL